MDPAGRIPAFGTYEQERLFILYTISELKHELAGVQESSAVERKAVLVKAQRDLDALHGKVRALETLNTTLKLKYWITTAALSAAVAIVVELGKFAFFGR